MEWLEIILIFLAALAGGLIGGYAGSEKTYWRVMQDREAQQHPSKEEYAVATQPAYYRPAPPAHNGIRRAMRMITAGALRNKKRLAVRTEKAPAQSGRGR